MSDFKAKMHQIRPRPRWGSLQRSPDPLAAFKGPTSKERGGREGEWKEGEEWEGDSSASIRSPPYFLLRIYAHGHKTDRCSEKTHVSLTSA